MHRPAPAAAQAAAGGLAVTPLPGMDAQRSAAAAAEVTPLQQQQLRGGDAAADVAQRLQRLGVTPMGGGTPAAAARQQPEQQQAALTPLERLAAAPVDLNITPLVAPPAGRQAGTAAAAASGRRLAAAAPSPLDVTPLAGGAAADRRSQLCISPLPGMAAEPQPAGSASPQGRSVLAERTNSGRASPGAVPLTSGRRGQLLPRLASPLPAAPEAEQPPLSGSPALAENQPLPSPAAAGGQHHRSASTAAEDKLKAASAASAEAQVALTAGSGALWTIPSAPADTEMADAAPSRDRAAAGLASHPLEFSFAAAQRSLEQLSSGAAWGGGGGSSAPVAAMAEAAAGLPPGLRDDILALHWDMLQQFQVGWLCVRLGGAVCCWLPPVACLPALPLLWHAACCCLPTHAYACCFPSAASPALLPTRGATLPQPILPALAPSLVPQAQQACMGQLVSQVLERNEALSAEVSALRKQLSQLAGRRDQFLWL